MSFRLASLAALLLSACGAVPAPNPPVDGGPVDAGPQPMGQSDGGLDLNDVSFLFPLPEAVGGESQLLGLAGLMPRALYDAVPVIIENRDQSQLYGAMRVVSARVDPCFPLTAPPEALVCAKQIRLVAQPLAAEGRDVTTEDASLHLFFDLTDAQFDDAVQTLKALRALAGGLTAGAPLDVHPTMRAQGLGGPYALMLKAMLARLCVGSANLSRVAFMHVSAQGDSWRFGAFDVVSGVLVDDLIPRTPELKVQGVQERGTTEFRSGELLPSAPGDSLKVLLSESTLRLTDEKTLTKALKSALTIENPGSSSPQTIDCGSCHVASRARNNAEQRRMVDASKWPEAYVAASRFDVRRVDAVGNDPKALRAFGYVKRSSALSLRTINESAVIAEALTR